MSGVGQFITLKQPPGCVLEQGEGNAVDEVQHARGQALIWSCPLDGFLKHHAERLGGDTQKDTGGFYMLFACSCVAMSEASSDTLSLEPQTKHPHLPSSVSHQLQEAGQRERDQTHYLPLPAFSGTYSQAMMES